MVRGLLSAAAVAAVLGSASGLRMEEGPSIEKPRRARALEAKSEAVAELRESAQLTQQAQVSQGGRVGGVCTCKSWRDVYKSSGVRCGQTNEYFFATGGKTSLSSGEIDELSKHLGMEFCTTFYEVIPGNFCINRNMGKDEGQWCYVDASCKDLSGGAKVNDKVSWKLCSPEDEKLRDFDPPALARVAVEQGVNLGLLNKMAYPLSQYRWKYVSSYWGASMDELTSVPQDLMPGTQVNDIKDWLKPRWGKKGKHIDDAMTAVLKSVKDSNVPTTFDTAKDQHPPHVIVQGQTVYVVIPSDKSILLCVSGCKK